MKRFALGSGVLLGALLTASITGVMYLADQLVGLPFVPFDFFDWITRVLPGPVVTFGIDLMIDSMRALGIDVADTAKTAEQVIAVIQFLVLGTIVAAAFHAFIWWRRTRPDLTAGLVIGALFGFPFVAISIAIGTSPINPILCIVWLLVLYFGWGVTLSWAISRLIPETAVQVMEETSVEKIGRRQFLITLGASTATITIASTGVGLILAASERRRLQEALADTMAHLSEAPSESLFPNVDDPIVPVPGTRPEYTPVIDHYKVFIRTEPTVIDGATWTLPIMGLVDNPLILTLDDLRSKYSERNQFVTLSCISGRIGTSLIGTTMWTGVSLQDVLAEARVQDEARYLHITSGDGFYESVELDLIRSDERIMLCYAWDGNQLPIDHGFPLRIWIPDRYGMKQPKWITGIEVTDEYTEGYWVERNWDAVAQVKATSVIDTVAVEALVESGGNRYIPVGGIAFAGGRGISKVEVRVDSGPWQAAELRAPLSETTWVIWRYEWPFAEGQHTFEVRCVEADGTPQIEEEQDAHPSGATGIHSLEATL